VATAAMTSTSAGVAGTQPDAVRHSNFQNSTFSAALASVIVADKHTPPQNGKACIEGLERALHGLGLYDFTVTEFCQPSAAQHSSRTALLIIKRAKEAKEQAILLAATTPSVKSEEVKAGASMDAPSDKETSDILASMTVSAPTAAYAPRDLASTTNSLDNYTTISTIRYMDPLTEDVESQALCGQRALAQALIEKAFLTHHSHVVVSCAHGDIAASWALARALCVGDALANRMDALTDMVALVRSPPTTWPELSHAMTQLEFRFARNAPADPLLHVGAGLLPQFVMRALQHANFDYLRVDIALLHKVSGSVTVSRIQHDLSAAHSVAHSVPRSGVSGRALYAPSAPSPPAPAPATSSSSADQVCFNFRDKGKCRYGDECRFKHVTTSGATPRGVTGVCVVCSSASHGITHCPVHKLRQQEKRKAGSERAEKAKLAVAKLNEEVVSLRAMMAAAPVPAPAAPVADPAQVEIRRLQAQLAAFNSPFYSYGPASAPP
jgi:hypothetical protein